ncbi:MAG: hypothetical protein OXT09_31560 [Myxococcales bacterium]|nr:hypothetical protein [Myxococcales bacterium]
MTFPNTDGLAPGSVVDIWSMDHGLGEFFVAGQGQVSADGTEIVTIEGGVREASWHFVAPTGTESLAGDSSQQSTCGMASQVGLADGCLEVDIQTPTYRSLGQERGVRLVYSSRRTRSLGRTVPLRVATRIGVAGGPVPDSLGYRVNVDGIWYDGEASINLDGFTSADEIEVSLDVPMEDRPSGTYEAEVEIDNTYGETRVKNRIETVFAHYNGAESPFAIGWGVDGLQRVLIGDEPDTFWGATVLDGNGDSSIFVVAAGDPLVELSGEIARRLVPPGAAHIDGAGTNQRLSFVPERADFELSADVAVDLSAPGTATFDVSTHQPGTLEQGTRVSTYLVRDPTSMRDSAGNGITVMLSADATFRRRILGIQLTDATLEAHDAELGAPGLDYSTTLDRGMEDGDGESVTWHGDGRVSFELMSSATDQVRVIVEAIEGDALPMFAFDFNSSNAPDREWNQITTTTSASTGSIVAPAYEYLDCGDSAMHCPANSRDRVLNMDGGGIPSIGVPDVLAHMVTDRVMQFEPGFYTLSAWVGTSGATTGQRERVYSAGNNARVWLEDVDTGADLALPTGWTGFSDLLGIIPEGRYEVRVFNVTGSGSGALHMHAGALVLDPASDGFGLLVDDIVLYRGVKFDGPPGDYSTLVRNEDDSFTRSYRDGSRVEFGSDGYQTAVVDRHGRTTRYLYISESDRRLQWIEDPAGRVTTFSYDEDGNGNSTLSHITGPDGRATHFTVESSGALTSVVFEDGTTRTFQYGAEAGPLYMVGETNQRGELKTRRYTDRGVFESAQFHDGPVEVADPVERSMTLGLISGLVQPTTGEIIAADWPAFDKSTHETLIEDGEGNTTRVLTSLPGATLVTTAPDGSVSTSKRDEDGNVKQSIAPSGHEVTRTFDAHGNVLTERDHVLMEPGEATAFTYGPYDQVTTVTDARGNQTRFDYDPRANLSGITSPAGRQVSFEYYQGAGDPDDPDPALTGLLKRHTDRFGTTTTWEYESDTGVDANMNVRRIVSVNGAETRAVTFAPGPYGRVASVTDDLSRTVSFGYDAMGRVDTQTNADSSVIGFGYDPVGLLSSVTPPGQPEHSMSYDQRGRLQSYAPPAPDTGQAAEDYDSEYVLAAETLDRVNLPGGRFIDYTPEPGTGRLESIDLQSRVGTYEIEYHQPMVDGIVKQTGLVRQVTTPEGLRLVNGYEHPDPVTGEPVPSSLLTSQTWVPSSGGAGPSGTVSWTFDVDGRLASRSVDGAWTIDYGYDEDGLLLSVDAMSLTLDQDSGYLTGTELIGVTTTADATSFGELDTFTATVNSDLVWSIDHDYDVTGQLDVKTETLYGVTASYDYDYDLQGRLEAVSVDGVEVRRYVYDDNGNRLELLENGAAPGTGTAGTYDDQDRLLSYGELSFGYNEVGQLATMSDAGAGETTSYVYDELGNLMQVTLPGGSVIDYEIDGQNRRVGKVVDGVVQWRLLYGDQLNPVARLDPAGNVEQVYVYGTRPHVPDFVMTADGGVHRVLSDHLGSVRVVVDAVSGVPVQWVEYDEFGNVLLDSNPGFQPFGFAGGLYDADTGLVRFGARDYDPVVGRWTAKDPILFDGGQENLYVYVGNDPVNGIDPSGQVVVNWECHTEMGCPLTVRCPHSARGCGVVSCSRTVTPPIVAIGTCNYECLGGGSASVILTRWGPSPPICTGGDPACE